MAIFNLKSIMDDGPGRKEIASSLSAAKEALYWDLRAEEMRRNAGNSMSALSNTLTKIFSDDSNHIAKKYYDTNVQNFLLGAEEIINQSFNQHDFESQVLKNSNSYYSNKGKRVSVGTLQKAAKNISTKIDMLHMVLNNNPQSKDIQNIVQALEKMVKYANGILKQAEKTYNAGGKTAKTFSSSQLTDASQVENVVKLINLLYAADDFFTKHNLGEVGFVFEDALALTNNTIDGEIYQTTDQLIDMFVMGGESISRGVGPSTITHTIQFKKGREDSDFAKMASAVRGNNNYKIDYENLTITYSYSPGAKRFGKMDVLIKGKDGVFPDYRVSAKHWKSGYGDVGWTSIDAGVTRAVGSVIDIYKLALLAPSRDMMGDTGVPSGAERDIAHEMAILALKSDLVMGYNQGVQKNGGYADTIVIKSAKGITVYNAATIALRAELTNYNKASLNAKINSIYMGLGPSHRTSSFLMQATSLLNQEKVTVRLGTGATSRAAFA